MKKYDELHAKAMVIAQYAFLAQRKGDPIEFVKLSKEAFWLERQAALLLQHRYDKEPTRSIFFKSAAFLAFDAQEYSECLNMILLTLLGAPDALIKKEINDLTAELFKMAVTVQLTPFPNVTKAA
jgi:hypothetical protein